MQTQPYSFNENSHQLAIVNQKLKNLPQHLIDFASKTKKLFLTHNHFSSLDSLKAFTLVDTLNLDNNYITDTCIFPKFPHLKTLFINNNHIQNLDIFLSHLVEKAPNLRYISMLKNIACPNPLVGKDQEDYQRYRYRVLYWFPKLRFIDSSPVTKAERIESLRVGKFIKSVQISDDDDDDDNEEEDDEQENDSSQTKSDSPSNSSIALPSNRKSVVRFGITRYVYHGRESEGNRFIGDKDL